MRSILALGMALLVLAAETPGVFVESPVCAAVDGLGHAVSRKPPASCCGSASCPMHDGAPGCGTCPMKSSGPAPHKADLCASSCAGGGAARALPGATDPGTLDPSGAPSTVSGSARPPHPTAAGLPVRNPVPGDPPPRV